MQQYKNKKIKKEEEEVEISEYKFTKERILKADEIEGTRKK